MTRATVSGYEGLFAAVRAWNVASRNLLAKLAFVDTGQVQPDANHGDTLLMARSCATTAQ